jgi:hypothetical protein
MPSRRRRLRTLACGTSWRSALDEHLHRAWESGGELSTSYRREKRRARGLPSWRLVRYADDFVVLVNGTRQDTEALREEVLDQPGHGQAGQLRRALPSRCTLLASGMSWAEGEKAAEHVRAVYRAGTPGCGAGAR